MTNVTFSGVSLGGALAQYAAYDFLLAKGQNSSITADVEL
jgi:hypothetical protein